MHIIVISKPITCTYHLIINKIIDGLLVFLEYSGFSSLPLPQTRSQKTQVFNSCLIVYDIFYSRGWVLFQVSTEIYKCNDSYYHWLYRKLISLLDAMITELSKILTCVNGDSTLELIFAYCILYTVFEQNWQCHKDNWDLKFQPIWILLFFMD